MKKIRFTVAISAYNIEAYVKRAIDSVLSQTFTDYECTNNHHRLHDFQTIYN